MHTLLDLTLVQKQAKQGKMTVRYGYRRRSRVQDTGISLIKCGNKNRGW
jgi:hypothetical protein